MNHLLQQTLKYYQPRTYFITLSTGKSWDRIQKTFVEDKGEQFLYQNLNQFGEDLFDQFKSECIGIRLLPSKDSQFFDNSNELSQFIISEMKDHSRLKFRADIFSLQTDKIYAIDIRIRTTKLNSSVYHRYQTYSAIPDKCKEDIHNFLNCNKKRKYDHITEDNETK